MATITDITITYSGLKIPQTPVDWKFRTLANFVCDLYLQYLNGYKPTRVSKIVLQLRLKEENGDFIPTYFGSICNVFNKIDEQKYHANSDKENLFYLLNLLHSSIIKAATIEKWDTESFIKAYEKIIENDFLFLLDLPEKKSKDGKVARPFIEKNLEKSYLKVSLTNGTSENVVTLIEKKNTNIFDSIYALSKKLKWFNADQFGLEIKDMNVKVCYSIKENKRHSNLIYDERMMIVPQ